MVALESAELFRNLNSNELRALRQVTLEREFMNGQEIFREGDPGDGVYLVKNGQVEISSAVSEGGRRIFSQIGPGGLFGEMAVIGHRPQSATATAAKDTTAYFIPRGELLSLIERSPGLAMSILQVISQRPARIQSALSPRSRPSRTARRHRPLRALHRSRFEESTEYHRSHHRNGLAARTPHPNSAPPLRNASAGRWTASANSSAKFFISRKARTPRPPWC